MPVIDSVIINYLPKNVAPEVEDVTVVVGSVSLPALTASRRTQLPPATNCASYY